MYVRFIKPLLDRTIAILLLAVLSPVFLLTALAVYVSLGSPVFFRQARGGFKGKVFRVFKFRTMTWEKDAGGRLKPDDERLRGAGHWVRRFSLDELPQLLNVLRGEMSLIGPRPLLADYLPLYTPEQARRHDVKPGITGLAQVEGRNLLGWEERFRLDVAYAERASPALDLKIALRTVLKLLRGEGIDAAEGKPMERFRGGGGI